jgi:hypothetical protein
MTTADNHSKLIHNLRNSIGAMQLATDLLLKFPQMSPEDKSETIIIINRQLKKLTELIKAVTENQN